MATVRICEVGITSVRLIIGHNYIIHENEIFIKILHNEVEIWQYGDCAKYFGAMPVSDERSIVNLIEYLR
jgi:hypothetical protein